MFTYLSILIFILLILFSGLLSASETALTSFQASNLKEIEMTRPKVHKFLKNWLQKPNELFSALLIGHDMANVLASVISTLYIENLMEGEGYKAIFLTTLLAGSFILLFGEITPKIIARNYSTKISIMTIIPLYYLSKALFPIVWLFTVISKIISRLLGLKIVDGHFAVTEKDIMCLVTLGQEEGLIEEEKKEMIHGVFSFRDITVKDILVPRKNVFLLEASTTLREAFDQIVDMHYSRVPVYDEDVDNIIGAIYLKDLLTVIKNNGLDRPIREFMRDIYYVPSTKPALELLKEFKKKRVHIAVVLHEYGGVLGIVTIEDILEEIVGDINDEYDDKEDDEITKINENSYRVNAFISIGKVNAALDLDIPLSDEYDTLSGFIYSMTGNVLSKGESVVWNNLEIKIEEVDNHAITEVILTKKEQSGNEQLEETKGE